MVSLDEEIQQTTNDADKIFTYCFTHVKKTRQTYTS